MLRRRSVLASAASVSVLVLTISAAMLSGGLGGAASAADVGTLAASGGCGKAPTLTSGTRTIQSSGRNRSYILRLPDGYDRSRQYRLIFGFHWRGGTAVDVDTGQTVLRDVWAYYGLRQLANNSAIFVAPQGLSNGWANTGGEDVTFVDDMIRQIEADLCVDTTQRFAVGFSYGGGMSYALACARANVFRAVAVYSGAQLSGCGGGTQPIAYLAAHGISDGVLNISGGRSLRDRFVRNNGCAAQSAPEPARDSRTHVITTYSGCRAGYPVVWIAFDGGHDASPADGANRDAPAAVKGRTTYLPAETWRFFTQFGGTTPPTTGLTTPPTSQPPAGGTCRVTSALNAWNTGLTEDITITNTGSAAINGWSLTFTLPGGQTIVSGWNATYSPNSGLVTARNVSYNGSIAPGTSVGIGFQANHTGNTARPSSFTLNGVACAIA